MPGLITYCSLFLSFAFGIVGMSLAINAVVESNRSKRYVQDHAPEGVTVDVDTSELLRPGGVLLAGCALLAVSSLLTAIACIVKSKPISRARGLAASFAHFFCAVWIFASLIAYVVIARNREAKVTAFLGDTQLPDSLVRQQEQAIGSSRKFWDHDYIRSLAIVPWFALLFAVIVGVERLLASRKVERQQTSYAASEGGALRAETRETSTEAEKPIEDKRDSL